MSENKGTLLSLLAGGAVLKQRVQHPKVHERKDRGSYYWFFRYWHDQMLPDGSVKTSRKFHVIGPSRGDEAITRKAAEIKRDTFLGTINAAPTKTEAVVEVPEQKSPEPGDIIFGKLAELWRTDFVEKSAAGKSLVAKPTREKYINALENHILPRWKDARVADLRAKVVLDWLQEESSSWHMMSDLRGVMSGIITKAMEWEIFPETFANPIHRVKLPKKWEVREKRILTEEQTAQVLSRLDEEGNLLICETCLDTGTRISEVTGLMIKHVDLDRGTIKIAQRNWRGDIDDPKTAKSRRVLALGGLTERYKTWIAKLKRKDPNAWVFPQEDDDTQPRWDSGVRQALKRAARAVKSESADKTDPGLDFPGFGPHSLRRANITWRQEVGGSSIEASKIAGHANTKITEEYTIVQMKRQEELTRRVQDKRAKAARKIRDRKVVEMKNETAA
jgi:integrase